MRTVLNLRATRGLLCGLFLAGAGCVSPGQQVAPSPVSNPTGDHDTSGPREELDYTVAIVNGDLILNSDVNQEIRFDRLNIYGATGAETDHADTRASVIDRLINRQLILQQMRLQPGPQVSDETLEKELQTMRSTTPSCVQYHCDSPEGWSQYLASEGFTDASFRRLWSERMQILNFTERRFQAGAAITSAQIESYYTGTLLPKYRALGVTAPSLDVLSDRIRAVLIEGQAGRLLDDWLQNLRAEGKVTVLNSDGNEP